MISKNCSKFKDHKNLYDVDRKHNKMKKKNLFPFPPPNNFLVPQ